jgi:hypothetical protein
MAPGPERFERFVAIDWSGAKGPRQRGIAVAMCAAGADAPELVRPDRTWSRAEVLDWLLHELPPNSIVGIDSAPALPFMDFGAYFPGWEDSPSEARALWAFVDALCAADEHLAATSLVDHPQASRHFRRQGGRAGDRFGTGRGRLRVTETAQAAQGLNPYSCMNLVGAAQVGKSSLTTMRVLHRLAGRLPYWPLDPASDGGSLIVEIYTAISARDALVPKGRTKIRDAETLDRALDRLGSHRHRTLGSYDDDNATDALLTAAWLRRKAQDPGLWTPAALTPAIARTEGWTFGVA